MAFLMHRVPNQNPFPYTPATSAMLIFPIPMPTEFRCLIRSVQPWFGILPVSEPFPPPSSQSHRVSGQVTIDEAKLTNSCFATGHLSLLSSRGRITLIVNGG